MMSRQCLDISARAAGEYTIMHFSLTIEPFRVGAIDYPILQKAMKELRKTYLIKD